MEITTTAIEGLLLLTPKIFEDERGYFYESFNLKQFQEAANTTFSFVQDNQSSSKKDVIRGLHFQDPPHAQGKLVSVSKGAILDIAVDIRLNSPTYGKHIAVEINEKNKTIFWIPPGFAHGFVSLEDNTTLNYKCTDYYHPECEKSLLWNDPDLAINWQIENPILSKKDMLAQPFSTFVSLFRRDNHDK